MSSFFNSFSARSEAGNCSRLRVECLKHRVEFRDRQQNRSQSIGSTKKNPVSVVSGFGARRASSVAFQCFPQFSIPLPIEQLLLSITIKPALVPVSF
jgi:hypothetical protein